MGVRSHLTCSPNFRHGILNSTGEMFFDTRHTQLDYRVAEDVLAHYDVTICTV